MDEKSLANIRDFELRIEAMKVSKPQESFVRMFLHDVITSCPVEVLKKIALSVAEIRRNELAVAAETN